MKNHSEVRYRTFQLSLVLLGRRRGARLLQPDLHRAQRGLATGGSEAVALGVAHPPRLVGEARDAGGLAEQPRGAELGPAPLQT